MREIKLLIILKNEFFPYKNKTFKTKEKEESEEESEEDSGKELDENTFFEYIEDESKDISYELFEKHFNFSVHTVLTKNKNLKEKQVNIIKRGIIDLKNKIEEMSKKEIKIEKPNKIVKIVEDILEFNKKNNQEED